MGDNKYEQLSLFAEDMNTNEIFNMQQTIIKEIVKQDDECTKQAIKNWAQTHFPKNENVRIDFLDESKVYEIIDLGIKEYLRRRR